MKRYLIIIFVLSLLFSVSCDDYLDDLSLQSGLTEGLVAYWPITESSGLLIKDSSDNGNDIVLTNTADPYFSTGHSNNVLLLGGTTRLGKVLNPTLLDQNNALSACMWIKITGLDPGEASNIITIFDKVFLSYTRINSNLTFSVADSTTSIYPIVTNIVPYQWFYLTVVYDGAVISIFIDGKKVKSEIINCIMAKPLTELTFASRGYQDSVSMEGALDEIRIYNRPLSQKEIKALMTIGKD